MAFEKEGKDIYDHFYLVRFTLIYIGLLHALYLLLQRPSFSINQILKVRSFTTFYFQVLKANFMRDELSAMEKEIIAIEEITQTLPNFCPSSSDHCLEC